MIELLKLVGALVLIAGFILIFFNFVLGLVVLGIAVAGLVWTENETRKRAGSR